MKNRVKLILSGLLWLPCVAAQKPNIMDIMETSIDICGVKFSTPAQYEKKLDAIVRRLTASNAKLIWGSTTPLVKAILSVAGKPK
jgi:hypothetical protein